MLRRLLCLVSALGLVACASPPSRPAPVPLRLLAINDFHGRLQAPAEGLLRPDPAVPGGQIKVAAGGAAHLATAVRALRNDTTLFVAAGDLVGATPLLSALFADQPSIESLDLMGLALSAVGNHEFDHGREHLLWLQNGGCPPRGCAAGQPPFAGARFQYLAASTLDKATGRPLLPAYAIRRVGGIPVGFIGLSLRATPELVAPGGVQGLEFRDEVETINALVPELRRQGVEALVVLLHEGGFPGGDINDCPGLSGPVVDIVRRLDPAVDLVISGHTHRAYICRIDGRLLTSADKYGTLLTRIDLLLDPETGDVLRADAENHVVSPEHHAADPAQLDLIARYSERAGPRLAQPLGTLATPLLRQASAAGESPLGRWVADAQLAATRAAGARLALVNPGSLRGDLLPGDGGQITYADLFAAQPFGNELVTLNLNGAELRALLEQQWLGQPFPRILQVSAGFGYTWDGRQPPGQRVLADSLRLDGEALAPEQEVRLTVNRFLAEGGDLFTLLRQGRARQVGGGDVAALEAGLGLLPTPAAARIRRLDQEE
ncbi:MAG: hypothetical protein RIR00_216 [Pseudomonadota bacterium]|jgi:5'-nucleotidase